ncbi:MAG: hypothetical protein LKF83_02725 [Solobacterium sp.]|jgi:hypothetical protein|nr:hypothetical protein [Solobacterium sp.]
MQTIAHFIEKKKRIRHCLYAAAGIRRNESSKRENILKSIKPIYHAGLSGFLRFCDNRSHNLHKVLKLMFHKYDEKVKHISDIFNNMTIKQK